MENILAIAGAIGIIGGAGTVIYKILLPAYRVVRRVKVLEQKAEKDYKAIQRQDEFDKALCRGMVALLNHEIDGNHVDNLKKARNELNGFLIGR